MKGGLITKKDVDEMTIEGYKWNPITEKWDIKKEGTVEDEQERR